MALANVRWVGQSSLLPSPALACRASGKGHLPSESFTHMPSVFSTSLPVGFKMQSSTEDLPQTTQEQVSLESLLERHLFVDLCLRWADYMEGKVIQNGTARPEKLQIFNQNSKV